MNGKRKRDAEAEGLKKAARRTASTTPVGNDTGNAKALTAHYQVDVDTVPPQNTTTKIAKHGLSEHVHVQIVTGSYEKVLHGFSASIPAKLLDRTIATKATTDGEQNGQPEGEDVTFSDTFLFAAHASAIRCLAISPPTGSDKRLLATGSSDERINVYSVSTTPPSAKTKGSIPTLSDNAVAENPRNRTLGSLIHHDRAITCLHFPTKGKLFSGAEDNTISISRSRDWTVLSSIKAPIPKAQGRPSGDTAGPGETPAGINDFAIHPSQKLMLSVGRGERCMRLWNLMTGKKAGVLNFGRELLAQVGEGKYSSGEGRRLVWDAQGQTYVALFERGAAVFDIDSKPRAVVRPTPSTKLHQMRFWPTLESVLVVSTEDGRLLFFDTDVQSNAEKKDALPTCACIGQLGGNAAGVSGRIKDFEILRIPQALADADDSLLIVTASSDGAVRLWKVGSDELTAPKQGSNNAGVDRKESDLLPVLSQVGELISTHETGNRITCLGAFMMDGKVSAESLNAENAELGAENDGEVLESDEDEGEE